MQEKMERLQNGWNACIIYEIRMIFIVYEPCLEHIVSFS